MLKKQAWITHVFICLFKLRNRPLPLKRATLKVAQTITEMALNLSCSTTKTPQQRREIKMLQNWFNVHDASKLCLLNDEGFKGKDNSVILSGKDGSASEKKDDSLSPDATSKPSPDSGVATNALVIIKTQRLNYRHKCFPEIYPIEIEIFEKNMYFEKMCHITWSSCDTLLMKPFVQGGGGGLYTFRIRCPPHPCPASPSSGATLSCRGTKFWYRFIKNNNGTNITQWNFLSI